MYNKWWEGASGNPDWWTDVMFEYIMPDDGIVRDIPFKKELDYMTNEFKEAKLHFCDYCSTWLNNTFGHGCYY